MRVDQALIASIGVGMVVCMALFLRAYIEVRFRFGTYLRSNRPGLWSKLAPAQGALEEAFTQSLLRLDATPQIASLRRVGFTEHNDPELADRCTRANRAERTAILSWFALLAWVAVVFVIIVAERVA